MSINVLGWELDGGLHIEAVDANFDEMSIGIYEDEVIDLTVSLLTAMKDKPAMQAAMERKLEELSKKLRGSNG